MKKTISVLLAMIMTLCSVSCLSLSVSASSDYYDYDEAYTVESETSFYFYAETSGTYEFVSYDNNDPALTIEYSDGTVETYDDVDESNGNYEFEAEIYLGKGEELFCTVSDWDGYDVNFSIYKQYDNLFADEEYTVESGYEFFFMAERKGIYEFVSFGNNDPVLTVEYEDGSIETYDDISDDDPEFDAVISLEAGEEIFCTVSDWDGYDVTFTIYDCCQELEADAEYTVQSGYEFYFIAEEEGLYQFVSYDNNDPVLTIEYGDGSVVTYDDISDYDPEFDAVISLEAGEEIFCTVSDWDGYGITFDILKYYDSLYADEEYTVESGYEFFFTAEEYGTYQFVSYGNNDPVLTVEYEDGSVQTYDDTNDEGSEFDVLISLEAGEEIFCSVSDWDGYDVTFAIKGYSNLLADVDYVADAGFEFFFTAEASGYYRFISFENDCDPYIEIYSDGETVKFDDSYDKEFNGALYLSEGEYIQAKVDDFYEAEGSVISFCIEYWDVVCPGHYASEWYIDEEATVYAPGFAYTECTVCGDVIETEVIPQLKTATPELTGISNTASGVKVTWGAVEGADNYVVYRKTYNASTKKWGGWTRIAEDVTSTSYTDKAAKSGVYYLYTVRAENEAGLSGYNTSGVKTKFLATPKLTSIANNNGKVTVKWNKVSGATGYIVYRKTYNASTKTWGGWVRLGTTKSNAYNDTKAKSGTYYRYTVRAYSGSYTSYFNTSGLKTKFLATPALKTATSNKTGVKVTWGKVAGATGYDVYRRTYSGGKWSGWTKISTVNSGSKVTITDKTAKKGVTYRYTVRAKSGSYKSYYNTTGLQIKDKY